MTTSNNPQKPEAPKTAPGKKDFNAFLAGKMADKAMRNESMLEKRAEARAEFLKKPVTQAQAAAFFEKKMKEIEGRSPEQKKAAEKAFFARKADQHNKQRESYFNGLKGQDRYAGVSDERLYKLAEARINFQRALSTDGIKPQMYADGKKPEFGKPVQMVENPEFNKKMEEFDKFYSNPKNLDAMLDKAASMIEQQRDEKSAAKAANTQKAGEETLER
ncbi:MAG: hypothetical protein PHF20_01315 [Halothiobacillaceae bacterium]|nr:hypothetical protein [Halothiobacillaceae bacterium]